MNATPARAASTTPSSPGTHRPPSTVDLALPLIQAGDRRFPNAVFAQRRARVLDAMRAAGGGVAIIAAAPVALRSRDSDYPYRQSSDFFYLTGFTEPDALLVLDTRGEAIGRANPENAAAAGQDNNPTIRTTATLFCREKDPERETWEGFHYGPDAARETFGFDAALSIGERDTRLPALLTDAPAVYYPLYGGTSLDSDMPRWLASVRSRRGAQAPRALHDLAAIVEALRTIKDADELARMRTAARISAYAHIRAMQAARPGVSEYAIEAELLYAFRRHGAQGPAYGSIVATGANACVLHYPAGDKILADGDLVLIDAACELDGYAADITRTFPANGRFSGPQRALYDIVLAANEAAAAATRPGARFIDAHQAALRILVEGMLDTGLLNRNDHGSVDDAIADRSFARFYMHSTSHWLGLDVHDCGDYLERPTARRTADNTSAAGQASTPGSTTTADAPASPPPSRLLQPGMVLTIEPGLYVRPADDVPEAFWNIGIRIEDDAVVTEHGCELITRDVPVDADDIEALMGAAR